MAIASSSTISTINLFVAAVYYVGRKGKTPAIKAEIIINKKYECNTN